MSLFDKDVFPSILPIKTIQYLGKNKPMGGLFIMHKNRKCVICGSEYTPTSSRQKYCRWCIDSGLAEKLRKENIKNNNAPNAKCDNCDKEFYLKQSQLNKTKQHFCCTKCHNEYRHKQKILGFEQKLQCCFKDWLYDSYINKSKSTRQMAEELYDNKNNYNSINYYLKYYNIEIKHGSEAVKSQWIDNKERRIKQSKRSKVCLNTKEARNKLKVIQQTKKYKRKISKANSEKNNGMYGKIKELNPNWNPDRTHEQRNKERKTFEYNQWRNSVFKKDKYICQCCGDNKGHNLISHHLDSYDTHEKGRQDVENGITLCETCHKEFHKIYGYGKNTKEQYKQFLKYKNSKNHNEIQLALTI